MPVSQWNGAPSPAAHLARPRHFEGACQPLLHVLTQHIRLLSTGRPRCLLATRRRLGSTLLHGRCRLGRSGGGPLLGCLFGRSLCRLPAQPLHLCLQLGSCALLLRLRKGGAEWRGWQPCGKALVCSQQATHSAWAAARLASRLSRHEKACLHMWLGSHGTTALRRPPFLAKQAAHEGQQTAHHMRGSPPACAPTATPSLSAPGRPSCAAASRRAPPSAPHGPPWPCGGVRDGACT